MSKGLVTVFNSSFVGLLRPFVDRLVFSCPKPRMELLNPPAWSMLSPLEAHRINFPRVESLAIDECSAAFAAHQSRFILGSTTG